MYIEAAESAPVVARSSVIVCAVLSTSTIDEFSRTFTPSTTRPTKRSSRRKVAGIVMTIDTTVPYAQGEQYPDSTYYAPADPGSRVTIESVGGEPFDLEAEYVVATNDFSAAGGDQCYVLKYANQQTGYNTYISLEDALINYTTDVLGGVIGEEYAEPQGRINVIQ